MAAFTMAAFGCIVDVAAAASVCGAADAPCLLRRRASMAFAALAVVWTCVQRLHCHHDPRQSLVAGSGVCVGE
jgi:hypothetical protein